MYLGFPDFWKSTFGQFFSLFLLFPNSAWFARPGSRSTFLASWVEWYNLQEVEESEENEEESEEEG